MEGCLITFYSVDYFPINLLISLQYIYLSANIFLRKLFLTPQIRQDFPLYILSILLFDVEF